MKLTEKQIAKLLNKTNEGETVICIAVPTRAFRVVQTKDPKAFRVEQLSRQAGDKWLPLALHKGDFTWEAYSVALGDMLKRNNDFMLEMRRLKVERNRLMRANEMGAMDVAIKR
jgi:hypothetical protein